jgi:hypothetical protein
VNVFVSASAVAASFIAGSLVSVVAGGSFDHLRGYLPALATMVAAYVGARAAFQLNADKEAEEKRIAQLTAGRLALFTLRRQLGVLRDVDRQYIEPYQSDPFRYWLIPAASEISPLLMVNYSSLEFLLAEPSLNLLGNISYAQDAAVAAISSMQKRGLLHLEIQPIVENRAPRLAPLTDTNFRQLVGERLTTGLRNETDYFVKTTGVAMRLLERRVVELTSAMENMTRN